MQTPVNELIEMLSNSPVNEVKLFINSFVGADTKLLASIYSTLANEIILFASDEDIMRALSKDNDYISINDLEYYTDLFMTSIQMDLSFFIKLSKAKETKGNFYEFIDMPLEAIANKLEGKEPELTDKEKKLNEMAKEYEQLNKQKVKENSEKNAEEQKEQIKNHWNIIKDKVFNRKKN